MTLWHIGNKMVMNEKDFFKSISSWIYVKSCTEHEQGVQRTSWK